MGLAMFEKLFGARKQAESEKRASTTAPLERHADLISGQGKPMNPLARVLFETRLGHDFSRVRIHDDESAAAAAKTANTKAFTVGDHVVLGRDDRSADLIEHELTHTAAQQTSGMSEPQMKEADEKKQGIGRTPPAEAFQTAMGIGAEDDHVLFEVDNVAASANEIRKVMDLVKQRPGPVVVNIRGYASLEGDSTYKVNLSAHRAAAVARAIKELLPVGSDVHLFAHGETYEFGSAAENRRAGVEILDKPETESRPISVNTEDHRDTEKTARSTERPKIVPDFAQVASAFLARGFRLSDENPDALDRNWSCAFQFWWTRFPNDARFAGKLAAASLGMYYARELSREHPQRQDEDPTAERQGLMKNKPVRVPLITLQSLDWAAKELGVLFSSERSERH